MNTKRSELVPLTVDTLVNFGVADNKHRAYGAQVELGVFEYTRHIDGLSQIEPGTYFVARVMATRGGKPYGAMQATNRFTTAAERRKYIDKRIEQMRKRAAKAAMTTA